MGFDKPAGSLQRQRERFLRLANLSSPLFHLVGLDDNLESSLATTPSAVLFKFFLPARDQVV